jgi:hypothetical protein
MFMVILRSNLHLWSNSVELAGGISTSFDEVLTVYKPKMGTTDHISRITGVMWGGNQWGGNQQLDKR